MIKLILVDPKTELCDRFREAFQNLPNVEIVQDYFEQLPEFDYYLVSWYFLFPVPTYSKFYLSP